MAGFKFADFKGEFPYIDDSFLAPSAARTAENLRLGSGGIRPVKADTAIRTATGLKNSAYLWAATPAFAGYWLEWAEADVKVVESPIIGDAWDRVFFTGDTMSPRYTVNTLITSSTPYPGASYLLGVPPPENAMSAAVIAGGTGDPTELTDVVYTWTYVTEYGEEGPPAAATPSVTINEAASPQVRLTIPVAGGGYLNNRNITHINIYKAGHGTTASDYLYVTTVALATVTVDDLTVLADLAGNLVSTEWDIPPTDMQGLTSFPGGSFIGYSGRELCGSEPGFPHAWPLRFRMPTDDDIIGIGVYGSNVACFTRGLPYIATGSSPASFSMRRLEQRQSCVATRGIVDMGDMVVWPSPDGLFAISAAGVSKLTESAFSKAGWNALAPETFIATHYDGMYIASFDDGGGRRCLVIDPRRSDLGVWYFDIAADGFHTELLDDTLYYIQHNAGNTDYFSFDTAGTNRTWTWRSAVFETPAPTNPGVLQIRGTGYPFNATLIADGVTVAGPLAVADSDAVRLPGGYLGRRFQLEVTGTGVMEFAIVAETMFDLRKV